MTQYVKTASLGIGEVVGTAVTLESIIFIAVRLTGSGSGGEHLVFRTTPNTTQPVGETHYAKWWIIIIAFDENLFTALFNTDVEVGGGTGKAIVENGDNTAIGFFRISIVDNEGTVIIWTWAASTTFVASYAPRITDGEDRQPIEVKFISRGLRAVG